MTMKIQETWSRWIPIKNVSDRYYVESITDTMSSFKIVLCTSNDKKKKIEITTNGPVDAYRKTVEGFRCQLFSNLDKQHKGDFYSHWNFFEVANSKYAQWIAEQSMGITTEKELKHFVVMDDDIVIDFVASGEPKVRQVT